MVASNLPLTYGTYISRMLILASIAMLLLFSETAHAGTFDAREVARINNCAPKKVELYKQTLGIGGDTIYRIDCNMPKAKGDSAQSANAVLIRCTGGLCEFLRAVNPEEK